MEGKMKKTIKLSKHEIQSGLTRVGNAEGLIEQLPDTHDGRNTWLMNYGVREEAQKIRANDAQKSKDANYTPRVLTWNDETECLNSVT
jgi:hypothetical protein